MKQRKNVSKKIPCIIYKEITYSENASIPIDDFMEAFSHPCADTLLFPYTNKRLDFLHENEVRIFKLLQENPEKKKSLDIALPDVCCFIKNVTVHPFAEKWYVDIVESVCKKYNIKFSGKSDLYDLEANYEV